MPEQPHFDQTYYDDWAKELHSQYIADKRLSGLEYAGAHKFRPGGRTWNGATTSPYICAYPDCGASVDGPTHNADATERTPEQDNAEYLGEVPWSDRVDE